MVEEGKRVWLERLTRSVVMSMGVRRGEVDTSEGAQLPTG